MKEIMNDARVAYVFYHLNHRVALTPDIRSRFEFTTDVSALDVSNRIIFWQSSSKVKVELREGMPVLFPSPHRELWMIDDRGNLVFNQDLLKSAFYLLSGWQEFDNQHSRDQLGRFDFKDSIQGRFNFTDKPIVNYYFEAIASGLERFCHARNIKFIPRRLFSAFGFLLTHDIDKVDYYTYEYLGFKAKEMLGLSKSRLPRITNIKLFSQGLLNYFKFTPRDNPYWNFTEIRAQERRHGLRSIFYFLDQGIRNSDGHYSFEEPRLKGLFEYLKNEGCEIGLHGTVRSIEDPEIMKASLTKLKNASGEAVVGIRQHRLLWRHPRTAAIQHDLGFRYDTTLGFAAYEGFRNSYCLPFKLYNFDREQMIDMWEFPLNVMDGTLFAYQNYSMRQAMEQCEGLLDEIKKFGGVFNLLWHNSFYDEITYPGINKFYEDLLGRITARQPENLLGTELCQLVDKL